MRILGLDVGTKTVGVAVSDPLGVIATGVTTIERVGIRKDTGKVIDYIREYGCETVVIGLPLSLDGEDSVQTQKVRDFRTMLENKLPCSAEDIINDRDESGSLIKINLPSSRNMPDAFVCNCDVVASRLITALRARGLRVPEDVSVTGFDDFTEAAPTDVPLSTFRADTAKVSSLRLNHICSTASAAAPHLLTSSPLTVVISRPAAVRQATPVRVSVLLP